MKATVKYIFIMSKLQILILLIRLIIIGEDMRCLAKRQYVAYKYGLMWHIQSFCKDNSLFAIFKNVSIHYYEKLWKTISITRLYY